MIDPAEPVFPNNVLVLTTPFLQAIDSDLHVVRRPLRPTDSVQSIGIFGSLWNPDEGSHEMRGLHPGEPTLQTYTIGIQALVKDGDEERGLSAHSVLSMRVRSVLYRSEALRVGLGALYVTVGGVTERARRWGVRNQRYLNNEIRGQFLYLSTLEFTLETEISHG